MNLLTDLYGAWHFDETSGAPQDSTPRGNHWSVTGAPGTAAGKLGTARSLTTADQFTQDIGADFLLGSGVSWTVALWFYAPTGGGNPPSLFMTSEAVIATNADIGIEILPHSSGVLRVGGNTGGNFVSVSTANTWQRDTWHLAIGWYDAATQTLGAQLDGGSPATSTGVGATHAHPAGQVTINGRPSLVFTGVARVDEVAWARRPWSAADRALFRNSGTGRAYPFYLGINTGAPYAPAVSLA